MLKILITTEEDLKDAAVRKNLYLLGKTDFNVSAKLLKEVGLWVHYSNVLNLKLVMKRANVKSVMLLFKALGITDLAKPGNVK